MTFSLPKHPTVAQLAAWKAILCIEVFGCTEQEHEAQTGEPLTWGALRDVLEEKAY